MRRKAFVATGLTVMCVAAVTACGAAVGQTNDGASTSPSQGTSSGVVANGASTVASPKPSQTVTSKKGFSNVADAELEVYDLYRHGDLVTLEFGLRSESKPVSVNEVFSQSESADDVSGIYLTDTKNKKKYLPAKYGNDCMCSSELRQYVVAAGQTQYLYATYGAPDSSVTAVDISFPHAGTFKQVNIR